MLDVEVESALRLPALQATYASLERHFRSAGSGRPEPIANPHREPRVSPEERRRAVPASVLIAIAERAYGPALLLTRRHDSISFGGHVCFPGGRADAADATAEHTALREAHEEIGLPPRDVKILGRLGDYVTHSGFCIAPFVGWVDATPALTARPGEVEEILEVPLDHALHPASYSLRSSTWAEGRAYYVLEHEGVAVTGPTVSILIGLYEQLSRTHEER